MRPTIRIQKDTAEAQREQRQQQRQAKLSVIADKKKQGKLTLDDINALGGDSMADPGVTITLREIYDSVQEVAAGVRRLDERITRLEEKTRETDEVDERSRSALEIAKSAKEKAEKLEESQTWLWRTFVGALITGAIGALFFITQH